MIADAILKLDKWLDTMRTEFGYTGPISHWWDTSLLYTGVQIDWRYEGIILGYLEIYRKTDEKLWLEKATRAADDVANNQLPNKKYLNSSFQIGPIEGGTPHEAAVDVGLLELAKVLKLEKDQSWNKYFECAKGNIENHLIKELWNGKGFMEQLWDSTLVPNKNATTLEALILYSEISGKDVSRYIFPVANVILQSQIKEGERFGGTIHHGTGKHELAIGIYTARCIFGVLRLFDHSTDERYLEFVKNALEFLSSLITEKGTYFGYYKNGTMIKCPIWISPSADILGAFILAKKHGLKVYNKDIRSLIDSILLSQNNCGGIPTAYGFTNRGSTNEYNDLPEFRDVLPVVGWNDKVLRTFSFLLDKDHELPYLNIEKTEVNCVWKDRTCRFIEDEENIVLQKRNGKLLYHLRKGQSFPNKYEL